MHKHFESDWANRKENMSNIQIPSTDLGLYHQKALYNWFFMHKMKFRMKKMAEKGIEPGSPGWQAKVLTTRPGGQ